MMASLQNRQSILGGIAILVLVGGIGGIAYAIWANTRPIQPDAPVAPQGPGQIAANQPPAPKPVGHALVKDLPAISGVVVGSEPGVATTTLVADGGDITISSIELSPPTDNIKFLNDVASCHPGLLLESGHLCTIGVSWAPTTPGSLSRIIVVTTSGTPATTALELQGTAIAPTASPAAAVPTATKAAPVTSIRAVRDRGDPLQAILPDHPVPAENIKRADWSSIGDPRRPSTQPVDLRRVIPKDSTIPAVLDQPIDSRNCGRIVAVVERDIYGADGRMVIIDRGSKAYGTCNAGGGIGNERLTAHWTRITRPDGVAFQIDAVAGDASGRLGMLGQVDNRLVEKYGSSVLSSALAAGSIVALGGNTITTNSALGTTTQTLTPQAQAGQQFGQDMNTLAKRIIDENIDIKPIITVPMGTRITIVPSTDIWLIEPGEEPPPPEQKSNPLSQVTLPGGVTIPGLPTNPLFGATPKPTPNNGSQQPQSATFPDNPVPPLSDAPVPKAPPVTFNDLRAAGSQVTGQQQTSPQPQPAPQNAGPPPSLFLSQ